MGIKLRNHINYDINNWITEEEAEKIFIAAGYVKVDQFEGVDYIPVSPKDIKKNDGPDLDAIHINKSGGKLELNFELKSNTQNTMNINSDFKILINNAEALYSMDFEGAA
ncbi:hypothetical protein [Metabacillus sp. FJAT-52054]|uniref:Uncharacterized protein n=1 Tax=Metabacillus sediminis TaxID=3117746 RepID=A0ABZ2NHW5_9BACI